MLTLTSEARIAIHSLTARDDVPDQAGLRIASASATADGGSPTLNLTVAAEPLPGDQVVDEDGARVFLDGTAAQSLDGHTLDVQLDPDNQKVSFFVA